MYVSRTQQFYLNAAHIEGMMVDEANGLYVVSLASGKVVDIPIREGTGLEDYLRAYGEDGEPHLALGEQLRTSLQQAVDGETRQRVRYGPAHNYDYRHVPRDPDPDPTTPAEISAGSRTADERRRKAQEFAPLPAGEPRDVRAWKAKADPDPCPMWWRVAGRENDELVTAHQGHEKGLWWARNPSSGEMFSGWEGQDFFPVQAFPASASA